MSSADDFEQKINSYLHRHKRSKTIWIVIIIAVAALLVFQGMLRGGFDIFQPPGKDQDIPDKGLGLTNIPSPLGGVDYTDEKENIKNVCVYDEFSKKGIDNVKIFLDNSGASRTTAFGCAEFNMPSDANKHLIFIKGESLLRPFNYTRAIDMDSTSDTIEFYVNLYDDNDLYEIAYTLLNEERAKLDLPLFKKGNDLNAQRWAEYLHKNMMTVNGMMENARAQIVHTHGYITKLNNVICEKEKVDCPPTYYTYSCESEDCAIERGYAVERIIDGIVSNGLFKSKEFKHATIGISYDKHVMFLVVNFA
jgi:hypothetical protein